MDNLYNKIYEAINVGIQNALVLPDELDSDVSVKFRHKTILNDFTPYEYQTVDLGLSVRWCKYNLGAFPGLKPEDWYGNYYAWGETETKSVYKWNTYAWSNDDGKIMSKYNNIDNKTILEPADDVIIDKYEGKLRMPTETELEELKALPNEWVENYNGIPGLNGRIFIGHNGNILFIPASGFLFGSVHYDVGTSGRIWSSSIISILSTNAMYFIVNSQAALIYNSVRFCGLAVRGVCP